MGAGHVPRLAAALARGDPELRCALLGAEALTMTTSLDPIAVEIGAVPEAKDQVAIDGGRSAASIAAEAKLDRSFARGIAWLGSVKWIVQLATWGTTIIVARILTPADYGLLTMGTVLLAFITLLSESGIGMTVVTVREISNEQIAQINGAAVLLGVGSFCAT